jgi:DNA modification methylase
MEGRHYVGYEISPDYCQVAEERVQKTRDLRGLSNLGGLDSVKE